jgi:hypothetical protein
MRSIFFIFCLSLVSCKTDDSSETGSQKQQTTNVSATTHPVQEKPIRKAELLEDSVSLYRYSLRDTLQEDFNCDGLSDQVYFSEVGAIRELIFLDGKSRKAMTMGKDLKVENELGADYKWVDFWGITRDTSTWEANIEDAEIQGSRNVALDCTSFVLRKEEAGGGTITYKKGKFLWVYQAD